MTSTNTPNATITCEEHADRPLVEIHGGTYFHDVGWNVTVPRRCSTGPDDRESLDL
jgi:hypothetical protein